MTWQEQLEKIAEQYKQNELTPEQLRIFCNGAKARHAQECGDAAMVTSCREDKLRCGSAYGFSINDRDALYTAGWNAERDGDF